MSLLDKLDLPADLKKLSYEELSELSSEIRDLIIKTTSETGGHLASNLGVVELTIALFRVLDPPEDKIIWDVGHQAYTHKILSGRKDAFSTIRQMGGLSGFPKTAESPYDAFDTGHSSTSISVGLGLAQARDIMGAEHTVVSVIGDGALTGGMAYEALNNASRMKKNFIIVLNDNNMSISSNVGGVSNYLNGLRTASGYAALKKSVESRLLSLPGIGSNVAKRVKRAKDSIKQLVIPGMFFEDMGITYLGPVDGHDIRALEKAIRAAKKVDHAVLLHVITKKGKGYGPAEAHPEKFHGVEPFEPETGNKKRPGTGKTYGEHFSDTLVRLAASDSRITAVTAAMADGTGLGKFSQMFPDRFFDVGIAEAHAVTSAAGMAAGGLRPVVAVYSSFLQRGFDQIIHDVCLQDLPVVFAVDRAGIVGSDGETHQGIFDVSYLSMIPGMTVMAPKNGRELEQMLEFAFRLGHPAAIRYPRGIAYEGLSGSDALIEYGKSEMIHQGKGTALFALGSMVSTAVHIREKLLASGIDCTLVNARFAKPLDEEMIRHLCLTHEHLVILEESVENGGIGLRACRIAAEASAECRVKTVSLPDAYVEHGDIDSLRKMLGIDSGSIIESIRGE